jgi:hypothetical protein
MGKLTPGATLIYESCEGVIYAREEGSTERQVVGMTLEAQQRREGILENELWYKIRQEAKTNPTLHDTLERAKMIYYLSRK